MRLPKYAAVDREAVDLQAALEKLLQDARNGHITAPLDWRQIPGSYSFIESGLARYLDLESAYADFKIAITGGESRVSLELRRRYPREQ